MFLGVNLGCATTLVVKIGLKMGWCTTFEIFDCIREIDTTEPENVSSIFALQNSQLAYRKCKAFLLDTIKTYHNTVLL